MGLQAEGELVLEQKKKCIVFGGSGFVGSAVVAKALQQGWQVRNFDVLAPQVSSSQEYISGNIRNAQHVEDAVRGCEVVLICTATLPLSKNKKSLHEVNVFGLENILQGCERSQVKKVVYISSSAVYGNGLKSPINEEAPRKPFEEYGKSKLRAEAICYAKMQEGMDITIIRPRTVLGAGRLGIFQILFEWILCGENVPLLGSKTSRYQFIHVEDLAECCIAAALRQGANDFNCGAAEFSFLYEELRLLCQYANSSSEVRLLPRFPFATLTYFAGYLRIVPLAAYHALMYGETFYFDIQKVERELHFRPQYSNLQMLKESYDYYKQNREQLLRRSDLSLHQSSIPQRLLSLVKYFI